jgi:hypothetical protein
MPRINPEAINEHQPGRKYIIEAFPTLFPTGRADFHEDRPFKVSAPEYFKHLMRYRDGRFAQHPLFCMEFTFTMGWEEEISNVCKTKFR